MTDTKMIRTITTGQLEIRSTGNVHTIEGHASTFNQPYSMGWYTEIVAPGAFTRTLKNSPDVTLLINHEGLPLARTRSGTLELSEDKSGLYTRATLDASDPDVRRLVPKMARGDMDKMSFGFGMDPDDGDEWSDDSTTRTMRNLNLDGGDVSIVTHPANPNATAAMRSRMLQNPDKLRALYRKHGKRSEVRSLLEHLANGDTTEASLIALSDLIDHRNSTRDTPTELRIARLRLELLQYS
jgi:HK97 family phage prohead protease